MCSKPVFLKPTMPSEPLGVGCILDLKFQDGALRVCLSAWLPGPAAEHHTWSIPGDLNLVPSSGVNALWALRLVSCPL